VLAKGPAGYWPLDAATERDGAVDTSGHGHPGSFHGGVAFGERGPLASGTAIATNGRDAYVEVPSSPALSQPSSGRGLTVEVWMRPDALTFSGQTAEHFAENFAAAGLA
jgi:hypothetical protein